MQSQPNPSTVPVVGMERFIGSVETEKVRIKRAMPDLPLYLVPGTKVPGTVNG